MNQELVELENTRALCQKLMQTPHYSKLGADGIVAIVETAKCLGIDPRQALNGGLYYVKGKVEMSARMMAALIREKKNSITQDKRSNDKICILHGKRADNNDTWVESFSWEEAVKAGLTNNTVWKTYPKDMLYSRALSRLARKLFPDIIGNCYVENEIALDPNITDASKDSKPIEIPLTEPTLEEVKSLLEEVPSYKTRVENYLRDKGKTFEEMPQEFLNSVHQLASKYAKEEEEVSK